MLGDLDLMQCGKDAPTMRRLSVELSGSQNSSSNAGAKDIPGSGLRRVSTSSMSSARSSMSQDSVLSPTYSSSLPNNAFYLDRVTSLLGRASSLPMDRAGTSLPSIPSPLRSPAAASAAAAAAALGAPSPTARPLAMASSAPGPAAEHMGRASALIRSLSKGMDSFR